MRDRYKLKERWQQAFIAHEMYNSQETKTEKMVWRRKLKDRR